MPNWCDCELEVTAKEGCEKQLKDFKTFACEKCSDGVNQLSANKFIPYPATFKKLDKEAAEHIKNHPGDWKNHPKDGFNQGGYEWCIANWGTKWGLCDVELANENKDSLSYEFKTAWSPPLPIIKKMGEMFPDLEFSLRYFECGVGFNGWYLIKNGKIEKDETGKYYGNRGG